MIFSKGKLKEFGKLEAFVFIHLPGDLYPIPAGKVTIMGQDRGAPAEFFYGKRYLEWSKAVPLDPLHMPLSDRKFYTEPGFDMFGVLRDAVPDSWGRFVIEKRAGHINLSEIDYLLASTGDRVGALDFGTDPTSPPVEAKRLLAKAGDRPWYNLTEIMQAMEKLEKGEPVDMRIHELLEFGSSMGGARPKAVVEIDDALWLAKFNRTSDRVNFCRIEYASMKLARICGLNVPEVRIETLAGNDVFLIKRFDRAKDVSVDLYRKKHFLSALTVTNRTEMESGQSSYQEIAQMIRRFCVNPKEQNTELYQRMVFNVLCQNSDDHLRNHGFIYSDSGWVLSPAYDIVPMPQAGHTRYLSLNIGVEGKIATLSNSISSHSAFGLDEHEARAIIEKVRKPARKWEHHYKTAGVSQADINTLSGCFKAVDEELSCK